MANSFTIPITNTRQDTEWEEKFDTTLNFTADIDEAVGDFVTNLNSTLTAYRYSWNDLYGQWVADPNGLSPVAKCNTSTSDIYKWVKQSFENSTQHLGDKGVDSGKETYSPEKSCLTVFNQNLSPFVVTQTKKSTAAPTYSQDTFAGTETANINLSYTVGGKSYQPGSPTTASLSINVNVDYQLKRQETWIKDNKQTGTATLFCSNCGYQDPNTTLSLIHI